MELNNNTKNKLSGTALYIIITVKEMQKRMLDQDLVNEEFAVNYDRLSREFNDFFEKYPNIFSLVVKCKDPYVLAQIVYFYSKCMKGEKSEEEIANMVFSKLHKPNQKISQI